MRFSSSPVPIVVVPIVLSFVLIFSCIFCDNSNPIPPTPTPVVSTKATPEKTEALAEPVSEPTPVSVPPTKEEIAKARADWLHAKPLLQKAVKTGFRADGINGWPMTWFVAARDNREKIEMARLYILGVDGSYSDSVLTGLEDMFGAWDEVVRNAIDDHIRVNIFRQELKEAEKVFGELDKQIWTFIQFRDKANKAYDEWKNTATNAPWELFVAQNPKYGQQWPGFFSTTVTIQDGQDRTYENYHAKERARLQKLFDQTALLKSLTVEQYEKYLGELAEGPDNRLTNMNYSSGN